MNTPEFLFPPVFNHLLKIGKSFLVLIGLFLLTACAATGINKGSNDYDYVIKDSKFFVRLEPTEEKASANSHPVKISPEGLHRSLGNLKAMDSLTFDDVSLVFTENELSRLATPLSKALSRAKPGQDITFQTHDKRGVFGSYSSPVYTTGRLFVENGNLNLILGVLHSRPNKDLDQGGSHTDDFQFDSGSRHRRIEAGWSIEVLDKDAGHLVEERSDWVVFNQVSNTQPSSEGMNVVSEPGKLVEPITNDAEVRSKEIETKLSVLEKLRAKGVISDDEYQQQRRSILEGI